MTEENKVSKEDTEEPLYFELKDNISSFYISDSDILKCILIADANHKIPTLDNNWIKQAEIYIQKNKKEDYSDKNIAKYQKRLMIFIVLIAEIAISAFCLKMLNMNLFFL